MADRRQAPRGQFAYSGLDRVLHEKARLGILVALATEPRGRLFVDIKARCALTDGNLSRHLQVLQEAGLVEIFRKEGTGRPQTLVRISAAGRVQFLAYLAELERVIRDAKPAARRLGARPAVTLPPGFEPT